MVCLWTKVRRLGKKRNMMDILYQLFYTVFSMSCMALVLLPVVLLLRIVFRGHSGRITMALWGILFLRAVCPLGMSSPVCLYDSWNRQFHTLLRSLGLEISPDHGLLTGWRYVFEGNIKASAAYRSCVLIWLIGMVLLFLGTTGKQLRLERKLKQHSRCLFDRIYQSGLLAFPVRTGLVKGRIYLPEKFLAKEMKDVIAYEQLRKRRGDDLWRKGAFLVCCIHWWNPGMWLAYYLFWRDQNMACDAAFVKKTAMEPSQCVQLLANMKKDKERKVSFSLVSGYEGDLFHRAETLLYLKKRPLWQNGVAAFLVTLIVFWAFALSAFHSEKGTDGTSEKLFDSTQKRDVTDRVIADCDVQVSSGSAVHLSLIVSKGTYQKGEGYQGVCRLQLKDTQGKQTASLDLNKIFFDRKTLRFNENVSLETADYNEDGNPEIAIGQRAAAKGKTGFDFYIIDIRKDDLEVVSPAIHFEHVTALQEGSMVLSYVQGAGGVITVTEDAQTTYYVWNTQTERYEQQEMTEEQLEKRRNEKSAGTQKVQSRYSLTDDKGREVMDVAVNEQENGGLSVKKLRINPDGLDQRSGTKTMTDVEGYYLDLQWAPSDKEQKRYALLTYNGTNGRTFSLYDIKEQRLCYRPQNGNEALQKIFQKYGASDDITFEKNGAVVYSLMEIDDNDKLKVNFAASAKDDVAVKGTYLYSLSSGEETSLQYSRE